MQPLVLFFWKSGRENINKEKSDVFSIFMRISWCQFLMRSLMKAQIEMSTRAWEFHFTQLKIRKCNFAASRIYKTNQKTGLVPVHNNVSKTTVRPILFLRLYHSLQPRTLEGLNNIFNRSGAQPNIYKAQFCLNKLLEDRGLLLRPFS